LHLDEEAIICDLAETYHVLDYRGLAPSLVAVLCSGLSNDSRIKRKIANRKVSLEEFLIAALVDRVSLLVWAKTEDAQKGRNKPKSILSILEDEVAKPKYKGFDSIDEFESKRAEFLRG